MELLDFFRNVRKLKDTKRTGWVMYKVDDPESVADHSFMLSLMAYVMAKKMGLDAEKCMKMGMIHDICEVYSGDIPDCLHDEDRTMSREEKGRKEREGLKKILSQLPKGIAEEFENIWMEFEARETRESKLVKDLDKLEMCIQAEDYVKKRNDGLGKFFEDGNQNIQTPEVRGLFRKIYLEYLKGKGK